MRHHRSRILIALACAGTALGCTGDATAPRARVSVTSAPMLPDPGATIERAKAIVSLGARESGADTVALRLAASGDSWYLQALMAGRRLHEAIIDSILRAAGSTRSSVPGLSFVEVSSGEDLLLGTSTLGFPEVTSAVTVLTLSGEIGGATSQVAYTGNTVSIKLYYGSTNSVGSRRALPEAVGEAEKRPNDNAQVNCIVNNPSNASVCGFVSYSEFSLPHIDIGQPCGSTLHGRTEAKPRLDVAAIGQAIDMINSAFRWRIVGPTIVDGYWFGGPPAARSNGSCVAPTVRASFGGATEQSPGVFKHAMIPGQATTWVYPTATVTNAPKPAVTAYSLVLDGSEISQSNFAGIQLGTGTYTLVAIASDTLLGLRGSATATLIIDQQQEESCEESGQYATLHVAFLCGRETGSPGGGGDAPSSDGSGYDCHWVRDYVIYTDGSWDWLSDWYRECEWAELRASQSLGGRVSANDLPASRIPTAGAKPTLRVRLLGSGPLPNGRLTTVVREAESGGVPIIGIDTTRGTAADLESALIAAQVLSERPLPARDRASDGIVPAAASEAARRAHGPESRAAKYLRDLLKTGEGKTKLFGRGRLLEVEIETRSLRKAQEM
jgi:hypothetical protein